VTAIPLFAHHGGHHRAQRPRPRWLARFGGLLHRLRTGEFLLPPAPHVPAREVAESARGLGSLERTPAAGTAPVISETGAVPPHPGSPGLAVGRHAASLPRRTIRPGKQPWETAQQPAVPELIP
jgi:hypothetical protein